MAGNSSTAKRADPVEDDQEAVSHGSEDGKEATSSRAEDTEKGEKKETLLEAVLKAVEDEPDEKADGESAEEPPPSEDAQSETTEEEQKPERKGPDLDKDPTPEELASYKKDTRARIEKLISERGLARQEAESLRGEANVTRTLREFLTVNDIAREDFQLTLDLAAAMRRGDFRGFLEGIAPYVNLATQALGITLPPDLDQSVRGGQMQFEAAAQISRERYGRALAEQQATRATQIASQNSQAERSRDLSRNIEQVVTAWENGIRQSDPDYARKEATVKNLLWSVVQERGTPQTPEQAVEIAKEAYNRANETIRQFAPPPKPTKAVPSSTNRASSGARSEPKSLMEAAYQGLERARQQA